MVHNKRHFNLVIIPDPRIKRPEDFHRMAGYVSEMAPDIKPIVLSDKMHFLRVLKLLSRPTMVFSPTPLKWFRPLRGAAFQGQRLSNSEELTAMEQCGIPVPKWALLTPEKKPDLDDFGPYVVVKPDLGGRGADVKIKRKARVRWTPPKTQQASGSTNWVVQEFIYTGHWPVSYRVAVLFGEVLYSWRVEADQTRRPLLGPNEFKGGEGGGGMSIVSSGRGCTFELDDDPEIISLAEKTHVTFPHIPLLGVDILKEPSGKLSVIEVNAVGLVWHFSTPTGVKIQEFAGFDLESQFDGIRKAARILVQQTRKQAR